MFDTAAFVTYILITAFTPGPNNIMSMSNASRLGFRKSFPFNLGILMGFFLVTGLCTLFSSLLFAVMPKIKIVMQVIGAAYMLYLAWKTWHDASDFQSDGAQLGFVSGALLQFINPKIYIYSVTLMSAYILPHFSDFGPLLGFIAVLSFTGFASTICWALFGSAFKSLFSGSGKSRVLSAVMALLLVYCAVSLFL